MEKFTEISDRIGEGSEFAATLTISPFEYEGGTEWKGFIQFDNDRFNFPTELEDSEGERTIFYEYWIYPAHKTGGTYLMNLLMNWWCDITALFERVRSVEKRD